MNDDFDGQQTRRDPRPFGDLLTAGIRIGQTLAGKYRVDGLLGSGGMGKVLRAHHLQLNRAVAIKVMQCEPSVDDPGRRFALEARATAALKSPHVVRILDSDLLPSGAPFLVMELLEGKDLARVVAEKGPLTVDRAIHYLLQAADAISEAHAMGIIHRDLKPHNLFLTTEGIVKVLDFGLAKALSRRAPSHQRRAPESAQTATNMLVGSPHYMSPEQLWPGSKVDVRTDIWGLGATFYHLLTGGPPFSAHDIEALIAIVTSGKEAPPVSDRRDDVSKTVDTVLVRALRRNPADRYQTIGAFQGALLHLRIELQTGSIRDTVVGAGTLGTTPLSTERDPPQTFRAQSDDEPTEITTTLVPNAGLASTIKSRR